MRSALRNQGVADGSPEKFDETAIRILRRMHVAALGPHPIGAVALAVGCAYIHTLSKGSRGKISDAGGGTGKAVSTLQAELLGAGHDYLAVVIRALHSVSERVRVAVFVALWAGSTQGSSANEGVGADVRSAVVVAEKAFLGPRLVVHTAAAGSGAASAHACLEGRAAADPEVCRAVSLLASHLEVLRIEVAD